MSNETKRCARSLQRLVSPSWEWVGRHGTYKTSVTIGAVWYEPILGRWDSSAEDETGRVQIATEVLSRDGAVAWVERVCAWANDIAELRAQGGAE